MTPEGKTHMQDAATTSRRNRNGRGGRSRLDQRGLKTAASTARAGRNGWLRRALAGAGLAALVSAAAGAASAETLVLRDFTLFDGTSPKALPHASMVIRDGRIAWIGPNSGLHAPKGARTVDLTGKYVIPGLIDLHVHLGDVIDMVQDKANFTRANVENDLRTYAAYGVTTVQSMGTDTDLIFGMRAEQRASGRPDMARIYTAGQGFVFKGGYGGLAGVNHQVGSVAEIGPMVDALAAKKVDLVKFWLDDELGHYPKMPADMTAAIITDAHAHGLPAAAHVFYLQDAKRVVDQGINGLAHSVRDQPADAALISAMKQHGAWQMAATLSREASMFAYADMKPFLADPFFTKPLSPKTLAVLSDPAYAAKVRSAAAFPRYPQFLETAEQNLKRIADAGVKYGFGTDAGPPGRFPGYAEHWELELMVEAGFTPAQALEAATGHAAEFLHAKDIGVLKPAKWADLVVLDADPLREIHNARRIQAVYVAGHKVKSINEY